MVRTGKAGRLLNPKPRQATGGQDPTMAQQKDRPSYSAVSLGDSLMSRERAELPAAGH